MEARKRYAIVGTGGRVTMFTHAIAGKYREHAELVGLCDLSQTRMDFHNADLKARFQAGPYPTYHADDFDRMIKETKPDIVIVTTMDCTHHTYIIRAMELGCDAISEKPMTIDAEKGNAIFEAINRTGRKLRVTFNYRYTPMTTTFRELLMNDTIGKPLAVEVQWILDTSHGADYFRRWHREKDKSGGLLVHKATHHFDLVNWLIGSYPKRVFCMGDLKFYGRKNAEARGESYAYSRYTGQSGSENDPFALNLEKTPQLTGLYKDAEKDCGYIRDRNVFGDNITIEDTMAICAEYRNGVIMSYSLIAYSPWEGLRLSITGTKGRIELYDKHGSHIITGGDDKDLAAQQACGKEQSLRVFPMFKTPYDVEIPPAEGGHGGGDAVLLEHLFMPNPPADPYNRGASHIDGAASMLLGISANESIRTGLPVNCDDLIKLP